MVVWVAVDLARLEEMVVVVKAAEPMEGCAVADAPVGRR